jgi:hypothetical protein
MKNGCAPSGRAVSIVNDILAKLAGRSGSKAYDAEYNRVGKVLEKASALEAKKYERS